MHSLFALLAFAGIEDTNDRMDCVITDNNWLIFVWSVNSDRQTKQNMRPLRQNSSILHLRLDFADCFEQRPK